MRVYRVEHKTRRRGPFHTSDLYHPSLFLKITEGWKNKLPSMWPQELDYIPCKVPANHKTEDHRLAVRTLAQLSTWFGHCLPDLERYGYVIRVYKVASIPLKDDYQVLVHIPKHKQPIAQFSPLDIVVDKVVDTEPADVIA